VGAEGQAEDRLGVAWLRLPLQALALQVVHRHLQVAQSLEA
jgi:hypothetical protein